ncbi:MAG: hypothetical protein QM608_08335 [Caulobacter sp.]
MIAALAMIAGAAAAQPKGLTFNDVETLPDAEIIDRTMAQIGADVVHVNRRPQRMMFIDPSEPSRTGLRLMMRPRAAARGLCRIVFWDVAYLERPAPRGSGPPEHVFSGLSQTTRYRIVGQVVAAGLDDPPADSRTEALCAAVDKPEQLIATEDGTLAEHAVILIQDIARLWPSKALKAKTKCEYAEECWPIIAGLTPRDIDWAGGCTERAGDDRPYADYCIEITFRAGVGREAETRLLVTYLPGEKDLEIHTIRFRTPGPRIH